MADSKFESNEFRSLLSELLEGRLSDEQAEALRTVLGANAAARELYARHAVAHALLQWERGGGPRYDVAAPASAGEAQKRPAPAVSGLPQAGELRTPAPPTGANSSSPLGFLSGLGGTMGSSPIVLGAVLVLLMGAIAFLAMRFSTPSVPVNQQFAVQALPDQESIAPESKASSVAKVVATVNGRWGGGNSNPSAGDRIIVGQSLQLISGVAEIDFDIGARIILQSPASLSIDSKKSIRMNTGKLTAEITTAEARGFKVITPEATFVDQGTEFGVEVSPGGASRLHVFKGEVDLALNSKSGISLPTQRLMARSGARVEGASPRITFVGDAGESFMRSMDETERDAHVVAYWRFEDQPLGTLLPDTDWNTNPVRATSDSTFSGNDLFVWRPESRPSFSGNVPAVLVPQMRAPNHSCLDLTDPFRVNMTRPEVYTNSRFSYASPIDAQRIAPAQWTVEASVNVKQVGAGRQTIVCRDGTPGQSARFTLRINDENKPSVDFIDAEERFYKAVSDEPAMANHWYHLAATSDGRVLRLYVNRLDGRGYRVEGTLDLPRDGSTALGKCDDDCSWAIGRVRLKKGSVGDGLVGWIDEVRICDVALEPSEFLFAEKTGP